MKKLLMLIALLAPLINAQYGEISGGFDYPKAAIYDDSLYTIRIDTSATPDDTLFAAKSTVYIPLDFEYEWVTITAIDTGATYDDSIKVWGAYYEISPNQLSVEDTSETFPSFFFKDSTNTQLTTQLLPVDDASIHTYTLFAGALGGIILKIANVEDISNRVWYYKLQAIKK